MIKDILEAIREADLEGLKVAKIEVKHLVELANHIDSLDKIRKQLTRIIEVNNEVAKQHERLEGEVIDFAELMRRVQR